MPVGAVPFKCIMLIIRTCTAGDPRESDPRSRQAGMKRPGKQTVRAPQSNRLLPKLAEPDGTSRLTSAHRRRSSRVRAEIVMTAVSRFGAMQDNDMSVGVDGAVQEAATIELKTQATCQSAPSSL